MPGNITELLIPCVTNAWKYHRTSNTMCHQCLEISERSFFLQHTNPYNFLPMSHRNTITSILNEKIDTLSRGLKATSSLNWIHFFSGSTLIHSSGYVLTTCCGWLWLHSSNLLLTLNYWANSHWLSLHWLALTFESICGYYWSHVMRKPVFALCEQQRRRSACASAQSDQRLCCSLPR